MNRIILSGASALLMAMLNQPAALADAWNKETIVTFGQAVEVPGRVLPAGKYVFKLMDDPANRSLVEIFNGDESRLVTTVQGIPDYRLQPPDHAMFTFEERAANSPEAIHAWFYPGDDTGVEFIYPRVKPAMMASARLLSEPPSPAPEAAPIEMPPAIPAPQAAPAPTELTPSPDQDLQAPMNQEETVVVAQAQPETMPAQGSMPQPSRLPATASSMVLLEVAGTSLLGAGSLLSRMFRRG